MSQDLKARIYGILEPGYEDSRYFDPFIMSLIALNVLVFAFLQGMGTNDRFTYAFSTVPQEIRTGEDIARRLTRD